MTNKIALVLGILVLGGFAYDLFHNDGTGTLFLGRKFLELLEAMAIWR